MPITASTAAATEREPSRSGTEQRFVTYDGTELAVWESGAAAASVTVVLAHGWTLDHRTWDDVVDNLLLGDTDLRIVTFDHRGHGRSGRARTGTTTIEQLGRDLHELIESYVPLGDIVLAGHSMGGMTIMELGARHPELIEKRVRGVAFVATSAGPFFPRLQTFDFIRRWWDHGLTKMEASATQPQSRRRALLITRLSMFGRAASAHDVERALLQLRSTGEGARRGFGIDLAAHDRLSALTAFARKPVAVVSGTRDRQTPPSHSRALAAVLPAATLTVLDGAGHLLPYERTRAVTGRLRVLIDAPPVSCE